MSTEQPYDPEARMLAELQQQYALRTGGGAIMILAGAGVILVAGVVLVSVLCFILWTWFETTWIGWFGWFFVYLLGMGIVMFREYKKSNVSFYDVETPDIDNPGDADSFGEYQMDRVSAGGAWMAHVVMWGPRALLNGITTVTGNQPTRFRGLLARAAQVVVQLYRSPDAMEIKKLVQLGENPARFREVLKWLDDNDYIGLSTDGKRVWLSSRVRTQLNAEGFHA
jgi:hypothetical protein